MININKRHVVRYFLLYLLILGIFITNTYVSVYLLKKYNPNLSVSVEMLIAGFWRISLFFGVFTGIIYCYKSHFKHWHLIDWIIQYRYQLVCILILTGLIAGINGYSLSSWDRFVTNSHSNNILFGLRRDITSDTWAISIPAIFSQIGNDFLISNTDIMKSGANAVFMSLPTKELSLLGRPFLWGYLTGNVVLGLSWNYLVKLSVLVLSSFEISYYLSKKNKKLALCATFFISFSPAIQWWIGQNMMDILIYFQTILAAWIVYWDKNSRNTIKVFSVGVASICGIGFITTLYPALQVPLTYLLIFMMMDVYYNKTFSRCFTLYDGISIFMGISLVGFMTFNFYNITQDAINMIANTAYPGKRIALGGGYGIANLHFYFQSWLLPIKSVPVINNCEAANFAPYIPAIFILFPTMIKRKGNTIKYTIFGYMIFLTSWLFIKFPEWFAKATLFSYVTESRVALVVGLVGLYLTIVALAEMSELTDIASVNRLPITKGIVVSLVILGILYLSGKYIYQSVTVVLLGIWFCSAMLYGCYAYLINKLNYNGILVFLCVVTIITGMSVNPIAYGEGSLRSSAISEAVQNIEAQHPDAYWIIDDGFPFSNYLAAQGIACFNTVNSYEDKEKWSRIDPKGTFNKVYNRYAHTSVQIVEGSPSIQLTAPDAIKVELTKQQIEALEIDYIMSKRELSSFGFKRIYEDKISGFKVYEVNH